MQRGEIYWVAGQDKTQAPWLIVSADFINRHHHKVIAIPLTWEKTKQNRFAVSVNLMNKDGIALIDQIHVVRKDQINGECLGVATSEQMEQISQGLKIILDL